MNKITKVVLAALLVILVLSGCGRKEENVINDYIWENVFDENEIKEATEKINPLLVDVYVEQDGKTIVSGDFSVKGNLVTINDVEYRILDIDGTKIKVLSMDRNLKSEYGKNEKFSYGEHTGTKYGESVLDKAMEEYYNSLPDILQNAIVEQDINQSMYKLRYDETDSNIADPKKEIPVNSVVRVEGGALDCTKVGEINVGKRKVYALDLDDLVHYLGGTFHADDMMDMFFKDRAASFSKGYAWLRSTELSYWDNDSVLYIDGMGRQISSDEPIYEIEIRPAFVIDLNKILKSEY